MAKNETATLTPEIQDADLVGTVMEPDFTNLPNCVEDARRAFLDGDPGPSDPTNFHDLRGRLEASRLKLPPLYRDAVFEPFVNKLDQLGPDGFTQLLLRDPEKEGVAGLMLDISHAILQNGERYQEIATDGFQEVVSDLYDGFLSAEDRIGVEPPDKGAIPPLVKWGRPEFGPYTWTAEATSNFGVKCAIVNLPPSHARIGLLGWATLGHETSGHDILHADTGLRAELKQIVRNALKSKKMGKGLPRYWSDRLDETASDVLGILNMGPSAGVSLIGYFRGLNAAISGSPTLRNTGSRRDLHPADILRGFLAASTVRLLQFAGAAQWADAIDAETAKDVSRIKIGNTPITEQEARESAEIVATALVRTGVNTLEGHALGEIQDWCDSDESIVGEIRDVLTGERSLPSEFESGIYAAHVVAAATTAAISQNGDKSLLFNRMLSILKAMHDRNPSWGPLFVSHPGNVSLHKAYVRVA